MSVLLNVIFLTCTEAALDVAEGGCRHWPLFSKSNKKPKKLHTTKDNKNLQDKVHFGINHNK